MRIRHITPSVHGMHANVEMRGQPTHRFLKGGYPKSARFAWDTSGTWEPACHIVIMVGDFNLSASGAKVPWATDTIIKGTFVPGVFL